MYLDRVEKSQFSGSIISVRVVNWDRKSKFLNQR